jgi:hypothetical protein
MSIIIEERFESRKTTSGDEPAVTLSYWIKGTDDNLTARAYLATAAPLTYDGLVRKTYTVEPIGHLLWDGVATYGRRAKKETGQSTFSFETGGGTQKITQSLGTRSYAPAGQTAPDFGGAIGVTENGVDGVDITVPTFNFSETHYIAAENVTEAYKLLLYAATGRVNSQPWRGYAAGEVLFLGASGSERSAADWEITFKFAASPNVANLVIGDITGITKYGWEYLWVRYEDTEDAAAKCLVKKPKAVYVEQTYKTVNFATLGIN